MDDLFAIDENDSKTFQKINRFWVHTKLDRFKRLPELGEKFRAFLDENLSVCGSIKEGASICRCFIKKGCKDPSITLELDSMYCVGEIPSLKTCPAVEPIRESLGFYKTKQTTLDYLSLLSIETYTPSDSGK